MNSPLFALPNIPLVPVVGESAGYPIGRIFCVGRNYAAHAAEMGFEVDREAPFYFGKSPANAVLSGARAPYPPGTANYHYEMELVVAIGAPVFRCNANDAGKAVYAYGCGLDMTRRDLQISSREKQRPWFLGKDVEESAVFAPLSKKEDFGEIVDQRIYLEVNGEVRQDATLTDLIWSVDEIIAHLSGFYHLRPGDLIMTGTPAGVGPVSAGDVLVGSIDGLEPVRLDILAPE